ncbi:MAG TPA: lysophospholipid acyltransferase family protein [Acidobacteriota bacterium]|nr:lysophospholipid acyltransferase family protein [Acidobacteriota bacterium]
MESYLVYALARVALGFFRSLPRASAVRLLELLAALCYLIDSRHRHIARVNLKIAFPDLSRGQRDTIARKSFKNTAHNLLEISRLTQLTPQSVSLLVTYDPDFGLNNFEAARRQGKGILYITGHFSAWELLPTAHALYGHPLSFVTRPLDNPLLERYLLHIREAAGNRVISRKHSARHILETLKGAGSVGILMDQNTDPQQDGIFSDFFGVPAATTSSVALFALRTGVPVLPGYLTSTTDGHYAIKFLPPLDVEDTGDKEHDLKINTCRFNRVMEGIIREQPESWLWGHRRWWYQPPGNPPNLYSLSEKELDTFLLRRRSKMVSG